MKKWIIGIMLLLITGIAPATKMYSYFVEPVNLYVIGGRLAGIHIFNLAGWDYNNSDCADFNNDRKVDGTDFLIWQTNYPMQSGATLATGDTDGDGDVDGVDFLNWQQRFPSQIELDSWDQSSRPENEFYKLEPAGEFDQLMWDVPNLPDGTQVPITITLTHMNDTVDVEVILNVYYP